MIRSADWMWCLNTSLGCAFPSWLEVWPQSETTSWEDSVQGQNLKVGRAGWQLCLNSKKKTQEEEKIRERKWKVSIENVSFSKSQTLHNISCFEFYYSWELGLIFSFVSMVLKTEVLESQTKEMLAVVYGWQVYERDFHFLSTVVQFSNILQ